MPPRIYTPGGTEKIWTTRARVTCACQLGYPFIETGKWMAIYGTRKDNSKIPSSEQGISIEGSRVLVQVLWGKGNLN
jgi:hypothetical protein